MLKRALITLSLNALVITPCLAQDVSADTRHQMIMANRQAAADTKIEQVRKHKFNHKVKNGLSDSDRKAIEKRLDNLPPEQKKEMREQAKDRWDSLTPEQKRRIKSQMQEKWDSLSPAERRAMKKRARSLQKADD